MSGHIGIGHNHGPAWLELESLKPPTWLELESVKSLTEANKITNLSRDTLKRRYKKYIVKLSSRREGMKLKHILQITAGELI